MQCLPAIRASDCDGSVVVIFMTNKLRVWDVGSGRVCKNSVKDSRHLIMKYLQ
jgi:hypothetical protein